ncbi:CHAT domain-containing protein [Amycolatopsis sp. NPDC021455]|uniref:CHAT domain-containing protein n=1 Tax=Amycolatopsis sp. NPDC021455 TaxID=3154901 RepID=UPI0033C6794F
MENLPGGLLDRIASGALPAELGVVRTACVAGSYAEALRKLDAVDTTAAEWRCLAWDGAWLTLPDGTNRPWGQLLERMPERPARPQPPRQDVVTAVVCPVLTSLRDARASLTADVRAVDPATAADVFSGALRDLDAARQTLSGRPDLVSRLDLLAGDLAIRAGQPDLAQERLAAARAMLRAAGDTQGLAVAALVAGDWLAAPLASPMSWNCVLAYNESTADNALPDEVEAAEFTGSTVDTVAAETAYAEADSRYEAAGDVAGQAAVAQRRAYLAVLGGRAGDAVELAGHARALFESAGRPHDAAISAVQQALAALADDRFPVDLTAADVVKDIAFGPGGYAGAFGLGLFCVRMGRHWAGAGLRPERAREALLLAERVWAALDEPWLRARTFADVAQLDVSLGDIAAARVAVLEALTADPTPLAEPADPLDPRRGARAQLAARMYNLANAIADVPGMDRAMWSLHEILDPLRAGMAGFTDLQRAFATALLGLLDMPGRDVATLVYRARVAEEEGDDDTAAKLFAEARAVLDALPADGRDLDEAIVKAYEGDTTGASDAFERYVEQALLSSTAAEARRRHQEGLSFQLNVENTARARAHYDALVASADPWWRGLGPRWGSLAAEGRLREQENDLESAAELLDEAIGDLEAVRATLRPDASKRAFFAGRDVQYTYLDATRVAMRLRETAEAANDREAAGRWAASAFDYAERARARALLDLLLADAGLDRTGLPADLVARWRQASAAVGLVQDGLAKASDQDAPAEELAELQRLLKQAITQLRAVEEDLQRANPHFWAAVNPQGEVRGLGEVAATLAPGTTLIQFVLSRTELMSWAITRDGMVAAHRFSGRHGIGARVRAVLDGVVRGTDFGIAAGELADRLLTPLREAVGAAGSLVVVPAGGLMRLPFAVLPWHGSVLGEAFPISVAPSASARCTRREGDPAAGQVLVVGDPDAMAFTPVPGRPPVPLEALPGARLEATALARLRSGSALLTGAGATAEHVTQLLPDAPVAHFATHGILDADSPLGSMIALASGVNLTTADFLGNRLSAGLIVLSACHTGEGEVLGGDELLGLGRVLFAAGARSAVVTLWAVDDRSAALVMVEFHRRLLAGDSAPEALRRASRSVRGMDRAAAQAAFDALREMDSSITPARSGAVRGFGPWSPDPAPYAHAHHWAPFLLISIE